MVYFFLSVLACFLCLFPASILAQTTTFPRESILAPEAMTNRRTTFFGDATAVGWNPALLGTRKTLDLVVVAPMGADLLSLTGQVGVFTRLSGFGVGYVANTNPVNAASGELYAGLGLPILDDLLWFGASGRLVNPGNIQDIQLSSLRYNGALLLKPVNGLYLSGGVTTMSVDSWTSERAVGTSTPRHVRTSPDSMSIYGGVVYSPTNWISVFANYTSPPLFATGLAGSVSPASPQSALNLDIGTSLTLFNDLLIASGNYHVGRNAFRVSAELNLAAFGVGVMADPLAGFGNRTLFARLSNDQARNISAVLGVRTDDDGCRVPIDTSQQRNPAQLLSLLKQENKPLFDTLTKLSSNPDLLYKTIQQRYYDRQKPLRSVSGEEIAIASKQNYALQVLDADNSKFPQVSVVIRAVDTTTGRVVSGLGESDFSFRDPLNKMVSVKPSDTTSSVPLDVVLIIDCSGSMQNKIDETRANARKFVDALRKRGADYRIGCILYGLYVVDVLQPTNDFVKFENFIAKARANQPDEYAPEAFEELLRTKFRPDAERVAILITDELTYTGGYRNGVEADIVPRLWDKRIKLEKIIKPCDNNGGGTAYATLGQEFNIKDSFERILNAISSELTTTYNITYRRNEKTTALTGMVKNETGAPLPAKITLTDTLQNSIGPLENEPVAGRFITPIAEGKRYTVRVEPSDIANYEPVLKSVNLASAQHGDTVQMPDIVIKRVVKPVILRGNVTNQEGQPIPSEISLTELDSAGTTLASELVPTDEQTARYEKKYAEGKTFTVFVDATSEKLRDEYIPQASEMAFRRALQGDTVVYNYVLNRYPKESSIIGKITVKQPSEQGLSGVNVTATDVATNAKAGETVSGDGGLFRLTLPKGKTYNLTFSTLEYYSDSLLVKLPKRDTTTAQILNIPPLLWKRIILTGKVEAEKTGVPVPSALVVTQRDSTSENIIQVSTQADGTYRMVVPKEMPLRLTAQSGEYFFTSSTAYFNRNDTTTTVQNFRLPEELQLRINFPSAQFGNPNPYILDSNGTATTIRWQDEIDRVVKNLLLFKSFIAKLSVIGHTDDTSDDAYNLKLGQNRAEFVVAELVKRGIPAEILQAGSEGETKLLPRRTEENTELYRARCRRVELVKTKR